MQLFPPFCPSCRESLARNGDSFTCSKCGRVYPLRDGVVDFLTSLPLAEAQQAVQKTFDTLSPSYDNAIVRLVEELGCPWSAYAGRLETILASAGGQVILDVGCGTAFPVAPLVPRNSIYIGLDVSREMLGHARSLLGDNLNAALWNVDVERIPLPDSCVDLGLCLMSCNVFPEPARAAEELRRVLKRDGAVHGTVFVRSPPGELACERPMDPQGLRDAFSVFDADSWSLTTEAQGGVLFFSVHRSR